MNESSQIGPLFCSVGVGLLDRFVCTIILLVKSKLLKTPFFSQKRLRPVWQRVELD
jgi:hypothetical protein